MKYLVVALGVLIASIGATGVLRPTTLMRFATTVWEYFDVLPAHSANTGPECLHHRLFGGEPCCQLTRSASAVDDLIVRVNAMQKAVAVAGEHIRYAVDLDDIHADGELRIHGDVW